jgi:predicted ABC-type transport system involved in lysophospholipase L1 biosynthesis ATPase subunit
MATLSAPLIALEGVAIAFGDVTVLEGVDLELRAGTRTAMVGRSGSGKTSLLLVAAGLLAPTVGRVQWPALELDPIRRRRQIAIVFQAPALIPELTALENVCLPLRLAGVEEAAARHAAGEALDAVGLQPREWSVLPAQLSGGEQQRAEVARALAGEPRLVIADEPTGALDRAHADAIVDALCSVVEGGRTALILATHDQQIAARFDRLIVIEDGTARQAGA